nr:hypothetical protein [Tanacetum cinerariifolium]
MLVNIAEPVNTARPRPVNTAGPTSTVVNDIKATCPITLISRNLMEDMLPLEEEKMVAELLLKELLKLEEIDIVIETDDVLPPSDDNDDDLLNELFFKDKPLIPRPPPEPPDVESFFDMEPETTDSDGSLPLSRLLKDHRI